MRHQHLHYTLLLMLCSCLVTAQSVSIRGLVQDTLETPLAGASVVLLNAKDSLLEKFALTEGDGRFEIPRIGKGQYIVQASFLGYKTFSQLVDLTQDEDLTIQLEAVVQDIDEVTIDAERIPIQIDGDTIKYNTEAFQTRPNASVEELLKKLPGVEVDRDGSIRAQGEEVSKVLVDGKEFFGDDPQIATKNLPADIVDQVQVFDEQSETAQFTGVDDGEREKTINLSLKEGKKQGAFGNIEAGYGSDSRYSGKANINRFSKKMQWSTIGRLNNVNEQGFTIQDYFNLMGGMSAVMSGGMTIDPAELGISLNGDDRRQGFLTTGSIGSNLNYDFNKKTDLSLNYFYNYFDREEDRILSRTSFLEEGASFDTRDQSSEQTLNKNHRLNTRFRHEFDSTQNIQLRLNMGFNDRTLDRTSLQETFLEKNLLQNSAEQSNNTQNQNFDFTLSGLYRKRFKKKGRSFVTNLRLGNRLNDGEAIINTTSQFLDVSEDLIQEQLIDNERWNYEGRLTYTEPLSKSSYLSFNYRRSNYEEDASKDFFDIVAEQTIPNTLLSNRFISDYTIDRGGAALQWNKKKMQLRLSLDAQVAQLQGDFLAEAPLLRRTFRNWLPSLNWNIEFRDGKSMNIRYLTDLREPSMRQLQPVVDNSNPLLIYEGNPALKPTYNHNISIQNMWFDQFSFTSVFAYFNLTYAKDQITNARVINDNLQQVIQPVNVDDNILVNGQFSFSTPIRPIKTNMSIRANGNYNNGILFVNGIENDVDQVNTNVTLALSNRKQEVLGLEIGSTIGYTDTKYSISTAFDQQFINQSYFADLSLNIKNKWMIESDISHTVYPAVSFGAAQEFTLWQASISRTLTKDESLSIAIKAFDLLNQNVGLNRIAQANFVQEEQVQSIGRYFMLSLKYRLRRFGS